MAEHFRPHDYQCYAIKRIVEDPAVALWLRPGLGKTIISLMAIKEMHYYRFTVKRVLVIAPKKVAEATWTDEAAKWLETKDLPMALALGTPKKRLEALSENKLVTIINRENVPWLVDQYKHNWPFDMVIIDEATSFKSHKAKRFKKLAAVRPHIKRIVELTGTPRPNSLMDLWAQMYLLDEGKRLGQRFGGFRDRYFNAGYAVNGIVYNYTPKRGAEEAVEKAVSDIAVSMSDEDYLDLPDIIYHDIPVQLSTGAMKKYQTMERQMVLALSQEDEITAMSAATLTGKLLQIANGAVYDEEGVPHETHRDKIDALLELAEELNGEHAIIFYNYIHDKHRIVEAMAGKYNVVELNNLPAIRDWNSEKVDFLLCHPASAGYGLNLQAGGHHIIWFGLTWNYEQYDQACKRLHRQGQKKSVIVHHLLSKHTKDEVVRQALNKKEGAQGVLLDALKADIEHYKHGKERN